MVKELSGVQDLLRHLRLQSERVVKETSRLQHSLSKAEAVQVRHQRVAGDLLQAISGIPNVNGGLHHLVREMPHLVFRQLVLPAMRGGEPARRWFFYGTDGPVVVGDTAARLGSDPEAWLQRIHPEDRAAYREAEVEREESRQRTVVEFRVLDEVTGEVRWLRETGWTTAASGSDAIFLDSYILDISQEKRAEDLLEASVERYRDLVERRAEYIRCFDTDRRLTFVNDPYCERLGRDRAELLGSDLLGVIPAAAVESTRARLAGLSKAHPTVTYEIVSSGADGSPNCEEWSEQALFDSAGRLLEYWSIGRDVSARKSAEQHILHLAHHDVLTGLPNRLLFDDRLQQALARGARERDGVAVMMIDLDHFKRWNDRFGHLFGDRLLAAVARRLGSLLRESDTVARYGGDEFIVLQVALRSPSAAVTLAGVINRSLARGFTIDERSLEMSASIGIALFPEDGVDADSLIRSADAALYLAKRDGGNGYHFILPRRARRQRPSTRPNALQHDLKLALERQEFFLLYQPRFDLPSERVVAVEALVRWQHPRRGTVLPARFIPIAEAHYLIGELGDWILGEACRQSASWQGAGKVHAVSVNLSPAQITCRDLVARIDRLLNRLQLAPGALELEITETMAVDLADRPLLSMLQQLVELGVRLSIDDFGSGRSSLAYLSRLPVHTLKIDRTFIRRIGRDPVDETIIRAVIGLAHSLGRRVVAEGVETRRQLAFLRNEGCDEIQGFLLSPPLSPAVAGGWLGNTWAMARQQVSTGSGG